VIVERPGFRAARVDAKAKPVAERVVDFVFPGRRLERHHDGVREPYFRPIVAASID
jgi:hypothetical protein